MELTPAQSAGHRMTLIGVAVVMGGCVLGGGTAIALHLVGQTMAAGIVAIVAGVDVLIGVGLQIVGMRRAQTKTAVTKPEPVKAEKAR